MISFLDGPLVPVDVVGDWNFKNERYPTFVLVNYKDIVNASNVFI